MGDSTVSFATMVYTEMHLLTLEDNKLIIGAGPVECGGVLLVFVFTGI